MNRFASITSGLLARKGEAQPWNQEQRDDVPPPIWRAEPLVQLPPSPPPIRAKDKSCSVRMSAQDFERLGILAVKRGVTRQQLMKDALAQLLASQAKIFACACMGSCEKNCD